MSKKILTPAEYEIWYDGYQTAREHTASDDRLIYDTAYTSGYKAAQGAESARKALREARND